MTYLKNVSTSICLPVFSASASSCSLLDHRSIAKASLPQHGGRYKSVYIEHSHVGTCLHPCIHKYIERMYTFVYVYKCIVHTYIPATYSAWACYHGCCRKSGHCQSARRLTNFTAQTYGPARAPASSNELPTVGMHLSDADAY